jgi:predicted Zn-dependent protease
MSRTVTEAGHQQNPERFPAGRFLSREECLTLAKKVTGFAVGGGHTNTYIESSWTGNVRWARNQISTCGDVRNNEIGVARVIRGASNVVVTNQIDPTSLEGAVRKAERLLLQSPEHPEAELYAPYMEPFQEPKLWFDRTYQLQAEERAAAMRTLVKPAQDAGMLSAGYIQVSAYGRATMDGREQTLYYPFTQAQYSVTVRDPKGMGSGWAGVDWNDWGRIDAEQLSAIALDKCLRSRNPVAVEPGRYTVVLEPQATCGLVAPMLSAQAMDRKAAENWPPPTPYSAHEREYSKIGEQLLDERITITADPMDPDLGFPPYSMWGEVYHPATWFENGVLTNLAYDRSYAIGQLGKNAGLPMNGAFKMSGGTTSVEEMIATTKRGVLVTRFSNIEMVDFESLLLTGVTRDGLWLIENGKVSKPIKNFRFTESPLFALNNLLQLGPPQRVFRPGQPTVVPPLKVQDFSFTSMADAI